VDCHIKIESTIVSVEDLDLETAMTELSNLVYAATSLIERLEGVQKTYGNAHHTRQRIVRFAIQQLERAWKK